MGDEKLKNWFVQYLKHRDVFDKKLRQINDNGETVHVKYKDAELTGIVKPILENIDNLVKDIKCEERVNLVTYNSKKNLKFLINSWDKLANCPNLKVIFANPDTNGDHKWIIVPHTHSKITPSSSLKPGLESLFQSVEEVNIS